MWTSSYLSDRPQHATLGNGTSEASSTGKQKGISATADFKWNTSTCGMQKYCYDSPMTESLRGLIVEAGGRSEQSSLVSNFVAWNWFK